MSILLVNNETVATITERAQSIALTGGTATHETRICAHDPDMHYWQPLSPQQEPKHWQASQNLSGHHHTPAVKPSNSVGICLHVREGEN